MTTWRRLLPAALVAGIALLGLVPAAAAQTPTAPGAESAPAGSQVDSWAVTPGGGDVAGKAGNRPNFTYDAPPGSTLNDQVTISNYGTEALTFAVYATDAFNGTDGSFAALATGEKPKDVGAWISLPQPNVTVPAHTSVTLPITITIPAEATPGDHVGAVIAASSAPGTGPDGKIVNLERRTGTRVYLRVQGDLAPSLVVRNVNATYSPSLNPLGGKATVTYRIQNQGNTRLAGKYYVTMAGPFGLGQKKSAEQDLPELLPGQGVDLSTSFAGVPAGVLDTATVHLQPTSVGGDTTPVSASSRSGTSLALPVTIVAVLAAIGLALVGRRAYVRRRRQQEPPAPPADGAKVEELQPL